MKSKKVHEDIAIKQYAKYEISSGLKEATEQIDVVKKKVDALNTK